MGKLDEVERELHSKEKEDEAELERRMQWRVVFPRTPGQYPTSWTKRGPVPPAAPPPPRRNIAAYFFGGTAVLLIVLAAIFVFIYIRTRGEEASVQILASDTTEAGNVLTIPIVVRNVSRSVLKEGELAITLPQGSLLREGAGDQVPPLRLIKKLNDLAAGEQAVTEISVRFFGKEGEEETVEASYTYRPENLRARFSGVASKLVRITKVPLAISWDIPETLSQGQEVAIKIRYILSSRLPFTRMGLRMEYPEGFFYKDADPKPVLGTTIWQIGNLEPEKEGVITIRGTIGGEEGEVKAFRAALGTFNALTKEWRSFAEANQDVRIAVTPLAVQGFFGKERAGTIKPGQRLRFVATYRNNTSVPLKNITVRAFLEGSILDRTTYFISDNGVVDFATGAVIWGPGNADKLKEVAPGGSDSFTIDVVAKDPPPIKSEADKNLTVKLRTTIEAATIPKELEGTDLRAQDTIEIPVSSKVLFAGKAIYQSLPASGPNPPTVGEKTSYVIVWEIRNFSNDLDGTNVTTTLPPNVAWEATSTAVDSPVTFDPASRQVRWHIGSVKAGTGILTPALGASFPVSITPSIVDSGKSVRLANDSVLKATDSFTKEAVERKETPLSIPQAVLQ